MSPGISHLLWGPPSQGGVAERTGPIPVGPVGHPCRAGTLSTQGASRDQARSTLQRCRGHGGTSVQRNRQPGDRGPHAGQARASPGHPAGFLNSRSSLVRHLKSRAVTARSSPPPQTWGVPPARRRAWGTFVSPDSSTVPRTLTCRAGPAARCHPGACGSPWGTGLWATVGRVCGWQGPRCLQ